MHDLYGFVHKSYHFITMSKFDFCGIHWQTLKIIQNTTLSNSNYALYFRKKKWKKQTTLHVFFMNPLY